MLLETITLAHHTLLKMLIEHLQNVWVLFLILQFLMICYKEVSAQGPVDGLGAAVEEVGSGVQGLD